MKAPYCQVVKIVGKQGCYIGKFYLQVVRPLTYKKPVSFW